MYFSLERVLPFCSALRSLTRRAEQIFSKKLCVQCKRTGRADYFPRCLSAYLIRALVPLTSAGSCIAMKPEVINACRLSLVDAMIGHDIVKNNYVFMLDKESKVYHP